MALAGTGRDSSREDTASIHGPLTAYSAEPLRMDSSHGVTVESALQNSGCALVLSRSRPQLGIFGILCPSKYDVSCALWCGIDKHEAEREINTKLSTIVECANYARHSSIAVNRCIVS